MKKLTTILGTLAISGALLFGAGALNKNNSLFVVGTSGLTIGLIGYIFAKSKEYEDTLEYK